MQYVLYKNYCKQIECGANMNYIVLDLEWNQAIKQDHNSQLLFEIIEIGAVKLDDNFKKKGTYQKLIKPELFKKIHPIVNGITKLQDRDFTNEKNFKYVIKEFLRWCGDDYIFCTYGNQDLYELQCNMRYHNVEIPWKYPFKYIDIQKILSVEYKEEIEQMSLEKAANFLKINHKSVYHRALGDALYTAEILCRLDKENIRKYISIDHCCLPETERIAKDIDLGTNNEYITPIFDNKDELLENTNLHITRCPECMKKCRKKIRWFSDGAKYLCVAKCEEHGLLEGIINIKKLYNEEKYYGIRKVYLINEEKYNHIVGRKEAIKEKRRQKRKMQKQ